MNPLTLCLLFAAALFTLGLVAALTRSNAILVLLGLELMLNGANVSFIGFWKFSPNPDARTGLMFVLFAIAFWILALNWAALAFIEKNEVRTALYILRTFAFGLILFAIIQKNGRRA